MPQWESELIMFKTDAARERALQSEDKLALLEQAVYFINAGNANTEALDARKQLALTALRGSDTVQGISQAIAILDSVTGQELAFATDGEIHGFSDALALLKRYQELSAWTALRTTKGENR